MAIIIQSGFARQSTARLDGYVERLHRRFPTGRLIVVTSNVDRDGLAFAARQCGKRPVTVLPSSVDRTPPRLANWRLAQAFLGRQDTETLTLVGARNAFPRAPNINLWAVVQGDGSMVPCQAEGVLLGIPCLTREELALPADPALANDQATREICEELRVARAESAPINWH